MTTVKAFDLDGVIVNDVNSAYALRVSCAPLFNPKSHIITARPAVDHDLTKYWASKYLPDCKLWLINNTSAPLDVHDSARLKVEQCRSLGVTLFVESDPLITVLIQKLGINTIHFSTWVEQNLCM